jgi:RNA polymerase sigma-70 factor (ECF subfamily)
MVHTLERPARSGSARSVTDRADRPPVLLRPAGHGYRGTVETAEEDRRDAADEVVARAWAAGDPNAAELAWRQFGRLVHTYCARALGDATAAADCTQETFVGAWRSRDRYDPAKGTLAGWLLGIARYKVVDARRAAGRVPEPVPEDPLAEAPGTHDAEDRLAERLLVAHALDTLPDRARQVVELTFYSQLSQTEIAERLDLPLGTVKSDVRRALQRLRPHLEGGEIRA